MGEIVRSGPKRPRRALTSVMLQEPSRARATGGGDAGSGVRQAGRDRSSGSPSHGPADEYTPDPNRWKALTVCLVAAFMTLLDELVPGRSAGFATALPLLVAGIGSGNVISPNRALTLADVPVQGAGSDGAVVQTGQRVGSAFGVAVVGAVFFDAVARAHGMSDRAYQEGVAVSFGFVLLALVVAVLDVVRHGSRPLGSQTRDGKTVASRREAAVPPRDATHP